jgi:hypothetical protein
VSRDLCLTLSLTGPSSHTVVVGAGVGGIVLGSADGFFDTDIDVGADDQLDWSVFDEFTTQSGILWPRWFSYRGNDAGWLDWSTRRSVERFTWEPTRPAAVDASRANIDRLVLCLRDHPVDIVLPESGCNELTVLGDPSLFRPQVVPGSAYPNLRFEPRTLPAADSPPWSLPALDPLRSAAAVDVWARPGRQAFDCASLTQFPELRSVSLAGELVNVPVLERFPAVTNLSLRYCPDLTGLPPLATWPQLRRLFVSNADKTRGQALRAEVRALSGAAVHLDATVRELRTRDWFDKEYGLPFAEWPQRFARKAKAAYRAAEKSIAADTSPGSTEDAVRTFTTALNALPDLDTIEREDAAEAVVRLAAGASVTADTALAWFNATRDF